MTKALTLIIIAFLVSGLSKAVQVGQDTKPIRYGTLNMVINTRVQAVITTDSSDHLIQNGEITEGPPKCKSFIAGEDIAVVFSGAVERDNQWSSIDTMRLLTRNRSVGESLQLIADRWGTEMVRQIRANGGEKQVAELATSGIALSAMFVQASKANGITTYLEDITPVSRVDHTLSLSASGMDGSAPKPGNLGRMTGGSGGDRAVEITQELLDTSTSPEMFQIRAHRFTKTNMLWLSTSVANKTIEESRKASDARQRLAFPLQMIYASKESGVHWISRGPCD